MIPLGGRFADAIRTALTKTSNVNSSCTMSIKLFCRFCSGSLSPKDGIHMDRTLRFGASFSYFVN